jgi:hypothetical protein
VTRFLLAAVLLTAGCASDGYHYAYNGRYCANPTTADAAFAAVDLFLGAIQAGAALSEAMQPTRPPLEDRPARPMRRVFGTVVWESGERVPGMALRVRSNSGFLDFPLTTDDRGRFWIPLPVPADWYRISVEDERGEGEAKVWLRDRSPALLEIVARPRPAPPTD